MTLFRKLFVTYLLVSLLAVIISGGFAGYMVTQSVVQSQMQQLENYGDGLARLLQDREWTGDDLRQLQSTADTLERGQSAHIWLVDRQGLVQMASSSATPSRGYRMTTTELEDVLSGKTVTKQWTPHARPTQPVVAVPVMSHGEVQGAILLSPSPAGFRQVRTNTLRFVLYGSLVATLVLAVVSYWISQRIARPLAKVSMAVRRVAQGDFSSRVEWRSKDEVGQLASAFNEMAEELDRLESARRELMTNVSHELKGPLTRIAGYLEAINDGIGGEVGRTQHFAIVRREVGRLTRLVNDMLDVSRLEAGRLKLHPIPCDLAPHIARVAEVFETPAQASGVSLDVRVPPILPIVDCEPERVEQVVVNLLENALAFTARGGSITLIAREAVERLVVEVRDTGPGLTPEELAQVWDRFYKVDPARTPNRTGFGLGLTIVRQLVELQGGGVTASSEPGVGSTFGFWLPLAVPESGS